MASELEDRVRALLCRSREMAWGSVRVMLGEEAVRLADLHGAAALGFEARQELVEAAVFSDLDERRSPRSPGAWLRTTAIPGGFPTPIPCSGSTSGSSTVPRDGPRSRSTGSMP